MRTATEGREAGGAPVCVVTGGSSGIGAATSLLFAERGWRVAFSYRSNARGADAIRTRCEAFGVQAMAIKADSTRDTDCRELAARVDQAWSRVDALVNNAGTTRFVGLARLDDLTENDFLDTYRTNVLGAFQVTRALEPLLRKSPAPAVINMSSIGAALGTGSSLAYIASKGALEALTMGLARALSPHVRVNAVAPGLVETPWQTGNDAGTAFADKAQRYVQRAALRQVVDARAVAEAVWWLATGARMTTGEVIRVDGGLKVGGAQ